MAKRFYQSEKYRFQALSWACQIAMGVVIVCFGWLAVRSAIHAADTDPKSPANPPTASSETPIEPLADDSSIEKLQIDSLPNAVRIHSKVISGGLPDGERAFTELQILGIKTIISVDGAKPDVALAEKFDMRYVHLPHGYDGISEQRSNELTKAVRDLPGPIYIHCHHGKHRSPAAAAVACVSAGLITKHDAARILQIAGTSESYRGLFESVRKAMRVDDRILDQLKVDFPKVAKIPALAEAMIEFEHAHDHLKALEQSSWTAIKDKPDLNSAHEALLMREHYTELLRNDIVKNYPPRFAELIRQGEHAAKDLENAVGQRNRAVTEISLSTLTEHLKALSNNCATCHREFRDVPLSEKLAK